MTDFMKDWAIWISLLSFILVEDWNDQKEWSLGINDLFQLTYEGVLLLGGTVFLMLTYYLAIAVWQPLDYQWEFQILFTLVGSYILQSVTKRQNRFGISLFILVIWVSWTYPQTGLKFQLFVLGKMVFGVLFFSLGLLGFEDKLQLFEIPPILRGLPMTFVLMALITLVILSIRFIA